MKKGLLICILFLYGLHVEGQTPFIKTTAAPGFGRMIRVLPMDDLGWIVFSMDSLNATKFNSCGIVEWSRQYQLPNATVGLGDVVKTMDDGIAILTRKDNGATHSSNITKLDAAGAVLWSKSYDDAIYDQVTYTINEDAQGNLVVFGNVEHLGGSPYYNVILKVSSSGSLLWTHFYDHGGTWGGSIPTSDNGILARTGNWFIKTDNNGIVQWSVLASLLPYNYYAPVEVSDGYIFTASNSSGPDIRFYKIDRSGSKVWTNGKSINYFGIPQYLIKRPSGGFAAIFNQINAGATRVVMVEFDKDVNVVRQDAFYGGAGPSLNAKDICFLSDNTPIVAGNAGSGYEMFVAKTDLQFKTDCRASYSPMTITATPYAIATGGTNLINFSLTEVNTVVSSIAFANPEIHFCYVPKVIQLGGDTTICAQTLFTLTNILSTKFDHYLWSNGDTTESIDISSSGKYWLQGIDNCEMSPVSDTIIISIVPGFNVDLGGDKGICENESLLLSAGACDSCSFLWSTGGKGDSLIIATKGSYWLQVTNKFGCITSDTMFVDSSLCECDMFFPNAFTPNDDDLNERFAAKYYCDLVNYHLSVFNRWGQQVFESIDPEKGWDGRLEGQAAPEGVYIYYVNYTPVIRGMKGKQIFKTGIVSVVN